MEKMVLIFHIVICVLLILLVLLQAGKEGMGVIFGGGNTSLFGSTGAGGMLVKLTTFVAIMFFVTSLGYSILSSPKFKYESTVIDMAKQNPFTEPPVAPEVPVAPQTPEVPAAVSTETVAPTPPAAN